MTRPPSEGMLLALSVGAFGWFLVHVLQLLRGGDFLDLRILYEAGKSVREGVSPYRPGQVWSAPLGGNFNKAPLVALLLSPATVLPFESFARAWVVLSVALYGASFVVLMLSLGVRLRSVNFYLLLVLFLVFQPTLDTLYGGQLEILLLLLLVVAYWGLTGTRPAEGLAGASIAFAALVKVYPAFFLSSLVVGRRRYWLSLGAGLVTLLGLVLFSLACVGAHVHWVYLSKILPGLSRGTPWVENQSFFGFFGRWFADGTAITIKNQPDPAQMEPARVLSLVAGVGATAWTLAAMSRSEGAGYGFVLLAPLVLLVSPNAWIHYETILLLPLAVLLLQRHPLAWLAAALIAFGNEAVLFPSSPRWLQSYKFYGVLLTWLLLLRAGARSLPGSEECPPPA